ncbi:hypothetical protein AMJ57_02185 [Parcubacteria bacterium SG8_24]|nr:MAG: hypothetical protein AMJ57_02185 [Parcubacteria bacterium SG8_24]
MNKKLITLIVLIVFVVVAAVIMSRPGEPEPNISLTAAAAQASFAPDESVVINLRLMNDGGETCVSDMASGAVQLVSVRKDGEDVATRTAPSYFITSFPKMLESSLVPLAQGGSLDITLASSYDEGLSTQTLRATVAEGTRGMTTFYDVGAPGTYELELMYAYPGPASPECDHVYDGSNTATVSFEITS